MSSQSYRVTHVFVSHISCLSAGENWRQLLKKISNKIVSGEKNQDHITRAVLRSQPPHASDVPDMVAWSLKYSGGSSGYWTSEICSFCATKGVAADLHIPGRFFEAITKLDFGLATPGRGVVAILKRLASSTKVVDNLPADIKASEIHGISRVKDIFIRASAVMDNCHKILIDKKITGPQAILEQSKVECSLIDFVLSKPDANKAEGEMQKIVSDWLQGLFGDETEPDVDSVVPSSASSSRPLIEYDDRGQSIDIGKMVLQERGVKVTNNYCRKPKPEKDTDASNTDSRPLVYTLKDLKSDGTCVLHPLSDRGEKVGDDSEAIEVAGKDFVVGWKLMDKEYKFLATHAGKEIHHSKKIAQDLFIDRIRECMFLLCIDLMPTDYEIDIRTSPWKSVFAKKEYETGKLLFVPYGVVLPVTSKSKPDASEKNCITVVKPSGETSEYLVHGSQPDDKVQNVFWAIQPTSSEEDANVKILVRECRFLLPTSGKLRISGHEYIVKVRCFENHKNIKPGDELRYYVPKIEKKKQQQKQVPELKLPAAKKVKR